MTIRPVHEKPPGMRAKGCAAITVTDIRWGRCDIKTVQLLPNCMAKQQALAAKAFDAIFVSEEGTVREGTSSNLFIVKDGVLVTHPLTPQILPGITRLVLLEICREEDLTVEEHFYDRDQLAAADEVFLSGTITEVLPITTIDGRPVGDGTVGPVSRRLYAVLRQRMGA